MPLIKKGIFSSALSGAPPTTQANTVLLDGSTQFFTAPDASSLDVANLTAGGWFYIDQSIGGAARVLMEKWDTGSNQRTFTLQYDNSIDQLVYLTSVNGTSGVQLTHNVTLNNVWAHIMVTYDGTDMKIYLNGTEVATSGSQSGDLHSGTADLTIGGRSGGSIQMKGSMSNILMCNRGWSADEVDLDYNIGVARQPQSNTSAMKESYSVYYPFNDAIATGREFEDFSGNENELTPTGSPTLTGQLIDIDEGLVYDSGNFQPGDFLDYTNYAAAQITGNLTAAIWVRLDSIGTSRYAFSKYDSSPDTNRGWHLGYISGSGKFRFQVSSNGQGSGASDVLSSTTPVAGEWYHLCGVYDGTNIHFYLNGILENSTPHNTGIFNTNAEVLIGSMNNGTLSWDGDLTNAYLKDGALDGNEVKVLANQNLPKDFTKWPQSLITNCVLAVALNSNDSSGSDLSGNAPSPTNTGVTFDGTEIDWDDTNSYIAADLAHYDANNDNLQVADDNTLDLSTDFTLTAVVHPDSGATSADNGVIGKQGAYVMWVHNGPVKIDLNGVTQLTGPTVPEEETTMLVCRRIGSDLILRVYTSEGYTETSTTFGTALSNVSNFVYLGNYSDGTRSLAGGMGFWNIWNRGLSDLELTELNAGGIYKQPWLYSSGLKTGNVMCIPGNSQTNGNAFIDYSGNDNSVNVNNNVTLDGPSATIETSEDPEPHINIPELELRLVGDSGFKDISPNEHAITVVGATQTAAIYNNRRALSCDGVNDYFQANGVAGIFNTADYEVFIVNLHGSTGTFEPAINYMDFDDNNSYSYFQTRNTNISNGSAFNVRDSANANQQIDDTSDVGANLILFNFSIDGTAQRYRVNNDADVSGTITDIVTNHDSVTFGALVRTANPSGTSFGDYDYTEILVFSKVFTDRERVTIARSLATKYGISF